MSNMHLVSGGPHLKMLFWDWGGGRGVIRTLTNDITVQVHSHECMHVCLLIHLYFCVFVVNFFEEIHGHIFHLS